MSTKEFTAAWKELSPIQRKAADWDEGPLLVLAGPGSGKTRVLTCRIAHILDSSQDENFRVLALTFTNKAADEMRNRVTNYVPGQEGRIFLGTFHSFCADVLRQHGTHLNVNPNFNIYGQDEDLQAILNDAVDEAKNKSNLVRDIHKETLPVIQRLKSRLILPEACRDKFQDPELGEVMAIVYPAYEEQLAKRNALDFSSLILKAYQLFARFPAFAKRYQTVYPYICVDEFQDTNQAQYSLLRALTRNESKNLFIVADDDQIIYQWNGASHKRIDEFLTDYSAMVVQIPTNYRCPPEIVEMANNLIRHNFLRRPDKQPLQAARAKSVGKTVRLLQRLSDLDAEVSEVARDIKGLHSRHLGSVAILGRSRRILERAEKALCSEGVPAVISQRKDEFESGPLVWLHSILRLTNDKQNLHYLEAICGSFAQLTQVEIDSEDIVIQARASNLGYLHQWVKYMRQKPLGMLAREGVDRVAQFLSGGTDFRAFSKSTLDWFGRLIEAQRQEEDDQTTEVFARYEEERSVWGELMLDITESLGDELTLEAFLQELQIHSKESPPQPDTVILMTIHGAKGKEFEHVYLIGLVEDELPSFQSRQRGDASLEMEEERRNCFVAITRTIETLTLSYAERYRGWLKEPSRFLSEMGVLGEKGGKE
ncbi:MAG: ATP-dependent helicase [Dehalococcoidia bacterium]|nr:ATP-dependent helicase [Dehalococcoidia bacterium]